MHHAATAHINLAALSHNLQRVKSLAKDAAVLAMIKANAYGHGLLRVANALHDADAFGVARIEEARQLFRYHSDKNIIVMAGFQDADELRYMAAFGLVPVVHTLQQIELLEQTSVTKAVAVWLKIDTGMHRLGFSPEEAGQAYERLSQCPQVAKPITTFTHFAEADELEHPSTQQQINRFNQVAKWPGPKSLANSAGIIAWPQSHAEWVRPGIMLYGVSPFPERLAGELDLQPVMTLSSELIAIHDFCRGDEVGYGGTWVCPMDMRIGVAAVGYGDGYPRHAQNGTPVLVDNVMCTLAGRVSMDLITIDLSNHPTAKIGDAVVLWGEGLPVEKVALCANTIAYELLCHVTSRVRFLES